MMEMKLLVNIQIIFESFELIIFVECCVIFYRKSITILVQRIGDLKKIEKMLVKENYVTEVSYYNETSIMGAIMLMKHNFETNA